eukprot:scaffold56004_cov57-Phaeocystis_antarctica.AAC.3
MAHRHLLVHTSSVYMYERAGGVPTRHTHERDSLPTRNVRKCTHTNTQLSPTKYSYDEGSVAFVSIVKSECQLFTIDRACVDEEMAVCHV